MRPLTFSVWVVEGSCSCASCKPAWIPLPTSRPQETFSSGKQWGSEESNLGLTWTHYDPLPLHPSSLPSPGQEGSPSPLSLSLRRCSHSSMGGRAPAMLHDSVSPSSPSSSISPSSPQQRPTLPLIALEKVEGQLSCAVMKPGAWLRVPPYLERLEGPPVHWLGPPLPVIQGVEGLQQDLSRGLLVEEQRPVLLTWG